MKFYEEKDYDALSRRAANIIAAQMTLKPDCVLGLATGSSPIGTYKCLIEKYENGDIDFSQVKTANLDEYKGLTRDNDQSYYYFMHENLFDHVNIDPANTNIPDGTKEDSEAECSHYEEVIASLGGVDLQLLGLGHNGHIGFNEPAADFPQRRTVSIFRSVRSKQTNASLLPLTTFRDRRIRWESVRSCVRRKSFSL